MLLNGCSMETQIDIFLEKRLMNSRLLKNIELLSLKDFIKSELTDYLQQYPEFNSKHSSGGLVKSLGGILENFQESYPAEKILDSMTNFAESRVSHIESFLFEAEDLISKFSLKISTIGGDFHWDYHRPFKLELEKSIYVVKPNRGRNTELLSALIEILRLGDSISVPGATIRNTFEIQQFIKADFKPTYSREFAVNYGRLLAFAYCFGLRDYHPENVIVSGARFVLLDNEIILGPMPPKELFDKKQDPNFSRHLVTSLLDTNLLPIRFPGAHEDQSAAMGGSYQYLSDNHHFVIQGYKSFKEEISSSLSLVDEVLRSFFDSVKIRAVFRPTLFYSRLLWRRSFTGSYFEKFKNVYNFDILHSLNNYPNKYRSAYKHIVQEEVNQLSKGCIPLFFVNDKYMTPFYGRHDIDRILSEYKYRLLRNEESLLKFALSAGSTDAKFWHGFAKQDGIVSDYLDFQDKKLFSNNSSNTIRALSLAYQPSSATNIVSPLDLGYYSGLSGIMSVCPEVQLKYSRLIIQSALEQLRSDNVSRNKINNFSSGASGMLTSIYLSGLLDEHNLNECLDLVRDRLVLDPAEGGLFDALNGYVYFLLIVAASTNNSEALSILSEIRLPIVQIPDEPKEYGLAHGFLGRQFLQCWIRLATKRTSMADEVEAWILNMWRIQNSANGICHGVDGFALVLAILQDQYGGLEDLADGIASKLSVASKLNNNGLCHGYVGQVWSRERFDVAFGTNTRSKFEDITRTNALAQSALGVFYFRRLADLSLFNGVCGSLALHRLRQKQYVLNSIFHLYPSIRLLNASS
jgi:hypothetical protein